MSRCIHIAMLVAFKVQNTVIGVKCRFKILEASMHHQLQVKVLCAYMSYRLCLSAALDKENKTHHLHFTPAKGSALIAGNPLGAPQSQGNLLSPRRLDQFEDVARGQPIMAKRADYMDSLCGCSNGTTKRLVQDCGSYVQAHAKKKVRISTRTEYTYAPYHDGYQWRKYGQKMIRGNAYPRCYYRCTYHQDHGCPATKHVEQTNSQDPPLFRVIYTNEHTCCSTHVSDYMASSINIQQIADASLRKVEVEIPSLAHCFDGHGMIKEENDAIISSLLMAISASDVATSDGGHTAVQEDTPARMSRSSNEAGPSISPVLLPASESLKTDFIEQLEPQWFEPLDLGWFIE